MKYIYPVLALGMTILIVYLSTIPDLVILKSGFRADQILSNLAHIPAYGILTILWIKSFNGTFANRNYIFVNILILAGLVLFSVSDEIHQSLVPGRFASIMDVGLDIGGILLGFGVLKFSRVKNFTGPNNL